MPPPCTDRRSGPRVAADEVHRGDAQLFRGDVPELLGDGHRLQLLQALRAGGKAKQAAAAAIEAAVGQREARDVMSVCERLPVVGVSWQAPLLVQRAGEDDEGSSGSTSYSVEIELQRLAGKGGSRQSPPRVYAPRFPKARSGCLCWFDVT